MKKKTKTIVTELPPIKIYLDEIQDIVEFLYGEVGKDKVMIETENYRIEDPGDFKTIDEEQLDSLIISTANPYSIEVRLTSYRATINAHDDTKSLGISSKIESILMRGKRSVANIFKKLRDSVYGVVGMSLVSFVVAGIIIIWMKPLVKVDPVFFAPLLLISIYCLISIPIFFVGIKRYSIIILKNRKETPTFWKRNKDQISMIIFTGLVTFFFGVLTTILAFRLNK